MVWAELPLVLCLDLRYAQLSNTGDGVHPEIAGMDRSRLDTVSRRGWGHRAAVGHSSCSGCCSWPGSAWSRSGTGRSIVHGQSLQLTQKATIGDVNDVVFSPNAQRIATLGRDRTIRVYDLVDGTPTPALIFHVGNDASSDIRFVGNDKLAVATQHGAVDIWDLDVSAAMRRLCSGIGEPISETQWRRIMPTDLPYRKPCEP